MAGKAGGRSTGREQSGNGCTRRIENAGPVVGHDAALGVRQGAGDPGGAVRWTQYMGEAVPAQRVRSTGGKASAFLKGMGQRRGRHAGQRRQVGQGVAGDDAPRGARVDIGRVVAQLIFDVRVEHFERDLSRLRQNMGGESRRSDVFAHEAPPVAIDHHRAK